MKEEIKETKAIILQTAPVIVYDNIKKIKADVEKRINDINIDNLVATTETVKSIKDLRATLNKEFKQYETERKAVKSAVTAPYDKFYDIYKSDIEVQFKEADFKLKTLSLKVDTELKQKKENTIKGYFDELCLVNKIDFVTFDKVGLNITLSASIKSLKDKCKSYIDNIVNEIELIDTQLHKTEILLEYRSNLNVALSIKTVNERKEALKAQEIIETPKAEIIQPKAVVAFEPPIVKKQEPLYKSSFSIKGTEAEIKALRKHIENNTNIIIL